MSVRILFNAATPIGQLAAETIDKLQEAKTNVERIRNALYAMTYPDTPTAIEQEVGVEAGKANDFFTLWDGINAVMNGAQINRLNEIDQG